MRESVWKKGILEDMERCNTMVFHIVASLMQEPGWPDEHVTHRYWQGFIEFKGEKTRLEKKQEIIIRELNKRQPMSAVIARYPDRIENHKGELIAHFDGTGRGLILKLKELMDLENCPDVRS